MLPDLDGTEVAGSSVPRRPVRGVLDARDATEDKVRA